MNPQWVTACLSRHQIVLVLDFPMSDYEHEDDHENDGFAWPAMN